MSGTWRAVLVFIVPTLWLMTACGGGGGPPPRADPSALELSTLASSAEMFRGSVRFAPSTFTMHDEGGELFTEVGCPGCRPAGATDGAPGVPVFTRLLAVPLGARVLLTEVRPVVREMRTLRLYPYQSQAGDYAPSFGLPGPYPKDDEGWTPPFAYDGGAFGGDTPVPQSPVQVSSVSMARDLRLVVVQIAAGQYVPASGQLTLFSSLDFTLTFEGGNGSFLPNEAHNAFDEGSKTGVAAVWNQAAVADVAAFQIPPFIAYGEELLILTHPNYRAAADRLALHKNARGLLTTVITVNDGAAGGGPDTKEEIKAFLDSRYAVATVRYSYLLLLGDSGDIEPWVLPRRYKAGDFPSDFPYAQVSTDPMADDLFPDVAVGRIAVNSLAQADVVVDKIIQYESSPPLVLAGHTFYGHAAIASYFQPGEDGAPANVENKRRFVFDSEEVRGHLVNHGFQVERIYTAAHPLTPATQPRYWYDGVTPLPPPLRPEDGYPWDGDAAQIIDAFNAGQTLVFHSDHGWWEGWGDPHFTTANLPSLTNGDLLPLVLSDNCSSGAFDYAGAGFAESLLRMSGGGAIGVMAFTRDSNNGVGREFLVGVVDALWPAAYPGYGDGIARHRLGDMLNHARGVMVVNFAGGTASDPGYLGGWCYTRMLTLFGDPSLAVWVTNPTVLPGLGYEVLVATAIDLVYPYPGATITVFESTPDGPVPIGRGVAGPEGAVHIDPLVAPMDVGNLAFFASAPNALTTPVSVSGAARKR